MIIIPKPKTRHFRSNSEIKTSRIIFTVLNIFGFLLFFFLRRPQRRRRPEFRFEPEQETAESADGFHRPSVADAREELRAAKIPERPGPHGIGGQAQPVRHTSQDLVPEQKVSLRFVYLFTVPIFRPYK